MSQGYALRTDGDCPAGSFSGGGTWGDWQVCCPTETYCPGNQDNAECLKSGVGGTLTQCANSTWNLFWKEDFFCCEQGRIGFISTENSTDGDFGCATDKSFNGDTMSSLTVKIAGTTTPTASASSSTSSTSTSTSTSTSSPTATHSSAGHSTNTGAIAGGVVGGICGAAIVAGLIFMLLRYRSRALATEKSRAAGQPQDAEHQQNPYFSSTGATNRGRSPFDTPPASVVPSDQPSELPPVTISTSPSELPTEQQSIPAELPHDTHR
ncbi:uncharacterized protein N7459_006971 [Penicillium hispanicum]|uniref:uncharacterized protein n=1 Tax=Penicillium hispanicum TaxID=1080232 RepID=UPI0025404648|nr:uncharacterized protein N7459_006971 [Penicillium hispanicum]KAJ5578007.1 hypothetical protein N7459_006971 [Penicillium hispanicum]